MGLRLTLLELPTGRFRLMPATDAALCIVWCDCERATAWDALSDPWEPRLASETCFGAQRLVVVDAHGEADIGGHLFTAAEALDVANRGYAEPLRQQARAWKVRHEQTELSQALTEAGLGDPQATGRGERARL